MQALACLIAAQHLGGAANDNSQIRRSIPMAVTRTFSIIKPDATRRNLTGAVTAMLEGAGLRVVASKRSPRAPLLWRTG
jgi:hypothetical protein